MTFRSRIARLSLALACAATVGAATDRPPMLSQEAQGAWQAIGRLNSAGYKARRLCTGTLIAPDRVLSAAHCVQRADGTPIRLGDLRFVAGWRQGEYVAVGRVADVAVTPGWAEGRGPIGADLAILRLAAPMPIPPIGTAPPVTGERIRILGYRADRPHALSDSGECLHGTAPEGARVTDCAATFGTSGAPVLQRGAEGWDVVGVVSAIGNGRTYFAAWRNINDADLVRWTLE